MANKKTVSYADKYEILPADDAARLRRYDAEAKAKQGQGAPPEVRAGLSLRAACLLLLVAHVIAGLAIWLASFDSPPKP